MSSPTDRPGASGGAISPALTGNPGASGTASGRAVSPALMRETMLYAANLDGAKLNAADLTEAMMGTARLTRADLSRAKLENSDAICRSSRMRSVCPGIRISANWMPAFPPALWRVGVAAAASEANVV